MNKTVRKVLFFVVPSLTISERKGVDTTSVWHSFQIPLGVLSIISYCKKIGTCDYEFFVEDLREHYYEYENDSIAREKTEEFVAEIVKTYHPDFILLSALFNTCHYHLDYITKAIESSETSAPVVIGGGYATTQWQYIFESFQRIDLIVYAEGEIAVNAILSSDIKLLYDIYTCHRSIISRKSINQHVIPEPEFIMNLDEIPFFDMTYLHNPIYSKEKIILSTSRGCPFNCVFCAAYLMAGKKIRKYSVERVTQDFDQFYEMGYRDFSLFDENFLYDKKRAVAILEHMIRKSHGNMQLSFPSGVMVARVDDEISSLFSQLHVKDVGLALESGSERVLKEIINKPLKIDDFKKAVTSLRKYGIEVHVFIVSGLPGETDEDRKMTTNLLKDIGITWGSFNLAIPLIGSRLHKICIENGYIDSLSDENQRWGNAYITLPDYDKEYLKEAVYRMNLDVNFIYNYDVRCGDIYSAIPRFKRIMESYVNHAFAYFMMGVCCYKTKNPNWEIYFKKYISIMKDDSIWRDRADAFNLPKNLQECENYCTQGS